MKTNPLLLGLLIAVAALGCWVAKISATLADTNTEIAALNKKLAATQHDSSVALTQSKKPSIQIVNTSTAPQNADQATKMQAAADPRAAVLSAQALPPGPDHDAAMMVALTAYADIDPQTAWDNAQNLPDDNSGNRLKTLRDILKTWSAKDAAQAAAKLATLSIMETSSNASNTVGTIEKNWLKQDPQAASQWVETLPTGIVRDSAIKALVPVATISDPPTAFKWADTLSDPGQRGTLINGVTREWAKTDPAAATAAVMARPNKNNGRQEALLAIIKESAPNFNPATGANPPAQ